MIIFALSKKLFRRFSARDLLLLSAVCGVVRWGLMGWSTALPWLIVIQILHCGTFTVCHLAAMRYIAARQGSEVIRLQAVYSAVAMGGSIAIMTVFAGFLYQHLGGGVILDYGAGGIARYLPSAQSGCRVMIPGSCGSAAAGAL